MKFHQKQIVFLIVILYGIYLLVPFLQKAHSIIITKPAKLDVDRVNLNVSRIYIQPRHDEIKLHTTIPDLQGAKLARCDDCIVMCVVCCLERTNETITLLKSAVALTSSPVLIIVFAEADLFPYFYSEVAQWPEFAKKKIILRIEELKYPSGVTTDQWKFLFKPCSSLRLFLPEILQDIDALLYVDTDVLFLSPLDDLWKHFSSMNSSHMAGLSQEHEDPATGWYNRFARHPFYGKMGVNSGVMLMNLTKMRKFGWNEYLEPLYKEFNKVMTWGDQDIINIIFHYHPDKLYLYGCEYNYRPDHCMYMSMCSSAEKNGVYVAHGSRGVFHNEKQPAFKAIYNAWREFKVGQDVRQHLFYPMQRYLLQTAKTNCGKLHTKTFLKRLALLVNL